MGIAVQSHYFGVGRVVGWAEPGVGAVATQSRVDVTYGPLAIELLKAGRSPEDTLRGLTAADVMSEVRQVAIVDATGRIAVHTGDKCIADAGHRTGDGYSVQANMMRRDTVWDAMAAAFERTTGDLAPRMLAALDAAEGEGGDIRGKQSAAMIVVRGELSTRPWERLIDVRVDDSTDPLGELRRLVALSKAYEMRGPSEVLGDNPELAFWQAVTMAAAGQAAAALPLLGRAFAADPGWRELLRRLPAAGMFPDDPELLATLTGD